MPLLVVFCDAENTQISLKSPRQAISDVPVDGTLAVQIDAVESDDGYVQESVLPLSTAASDVEDASEITSSGGLYPTQISIEDLSQSLPYTGLVIFNEEFAEDLLLETKFAASIVSTEYVDDVDHNTRWAIVVSSSTLEDLALVGSLEGHINAIVLSPTDLKDNVVALANSVLYTAPISSINNVEEITRTAIITDEKELVTSSETASRIPVVALATDVYPLPIPLPPQVIYILARTAADEPVAESFSSVTVDRAEVTLSIESTKTSPIMVKSTAGSLVLDETTGTYVFLTGKVATASVPETTGTPIHIAPAVIPGVYVAYTFLGLSNTAVSQAYSLTSMVSLVSITGQVTDNPSSVGSISSLPRLTNTVTSGAYSQ